MTAARIIATTIGEPAPARLIGWVSAATMAELLEVSESTIWDWVKHGALPKPQKIRGVTRWRWSDVEIFLDAAANGTKVTTDDIDDPILRASRGR
jgi:predicted DNA-binding transcriptional regulator AlpA